MQLDPVVHLEGSELLGGSASANGQASAAERANRRYVCEFPQASRLRHSVVRSTGAVPGLCY